MCRIYSILLFMSLNLFNTSTHAFDEQPLRVAVPLLDGVFNREYDGREARIIKAVLQECGLKAKFLLKPFGNHYSYYENNNSVDAISTVEQNIKLTGYPTQVYVGIQNGVSYLASDKPVNSLADLKGKRVVSFATASKILPSLADFTHSFSSYSEVANQVIHNKLLEAGRVDAIISDGLVVAINNLPKGGKPTLDIHFKALFPTTYNTLYFRDQVLQKKFDGCLGTLNTNGTIDDINKIYIAPYKTVLRDQYLNH